MAVSGTLFILAKGAGEDSRHVLRPWTKIRSTAEDTQNVLNMRVRTRKEAAKAAGWIR